jgi:hypothetical protein
MHQYDKVPTDRLKPFPLSIFSLQQTPDAKTLSVVVFISHETVLTLEPNRQHDQEQMVKQQTVILSDKELSDGEPKNIEQSDQQSNEKRFVSRVTLLR